MSGPVNKVVALQSAAFSRRNFATVFICVLANLVDGFDVLAIAFTAPAIAREWTIGPELLGVVFSAGLAGITLGSLFLSSLADRLGRRPLALGCLAAMAFSMLACGAAVSLWQLVILRFITGLGVGGILATLNSVVAETATPTHRNLAISIFTAAYPLGSMLGGGLAAYLIESHGWRSIYVTGGALTMIVLLLHWIFLPEKPDVDYKAEDRAGMRNAAAQRDQQIQPTLLLSAGFFFHMACVFFILNWTPKLVEQAGFAPQAGVMAAMAINFGSLLGGLAFGLLADRTGPFRIARIYFAGFAVTLFLLSFISDNINLLYVVAAVSGLCMGGAMTSLYALAPMVFPASSRVGRTGIAIGVGRCGGISGPLIAGYALAAGFGAQALYVGYSLLPAIVIILLTFLWRQQKSLEITG